MSGFFLLHRGWRDNPIFKGEFSRADAWVWLIENACWQPSRVRIKGETVTLERGELTFSQRFLAEKWGWSKSRVDRFIADLRDESMIETRSKIGATTDHKAGQGQSIISICNYAKYQDVNDGERGNVEPEAGATAGQQRGNSGAKKNKGTREQDIEEEPIGSPSTAHAPEAAPATNTPPQARSAKVDPFPRPEWADPAVWDDFLKNRKAKRLTNTATAHAKLLRDIDALCDPQWPPGRILEAIVARGWGAAYDPRPKEPRNAQPYHGQQPRDPRDGVIRYLDGLLELDPAPQPAGPARRSDHGGAGGNLLNAPPGARTLR